VELLRPTMSDWWSNLDCTVGSIWGQQCKG